MKRKTRKRMISLVLVLMMGVEPVFVVASEEMTGSAVDADSLINELSDAEYSYEELEEEICISDSTEIIEDEDEIIIVNADEYGDLDDIPVGDDEIIFDDSYSDLDDIPVGDDDIIFEDGELAADSMICGDYEYRLLADGTAELWKYNGTITENILIPSTLNGYSVTSIGRYAYPENLTGTLIIPDGIKTISNLAFYNCQFTGGLIIPDSVVTIGARAFSDCSFDGELILGSNLTSIGAYAFSGCGFTGDIFIPQSVETIGAYAFYNSHDLNEEGAFIVSKLPAYITANALGSPGYESAYRKINVEEIGVGQSVQCKVKYDGFLLSQPVVKKWSSNAPDMLSVDENGIITGLYCGQTWLEAELYNGQVITTQVNVSGQLFDVEESTFTPSTAPSSDKFSDLWVNDRINVKDEYGSIESISIVSGNENIAIEEVDNQYVITCLKVGTAVIRVNTVLENCTGNDFVLNITGGAPNIQYTYDRKSFKLGERLSRGEFQNLSLGFRGPEIFISDEDEENFYIHGARIAWGGPDIIEERTKSATVFCRDLDYECPLGRMIAREAVYPGQVELLFYNNWPDFFNGGSPLGTETVMIEYPEITHDLKSTYSVGEEQDISVYLDNTAYQNLKLDELLNKYERLYYLPKLEIVSGSECLEIVDNPEITTLSLKQKIRFKKAGNAVLKITYEPSGVDAPLNKVYQPETTVNIQINEAEVPETEAKTPETEAKVPIREKITLTFDSAGGSSVSSQKTDKGSCFVEPKDPVRTGYVFKGWYLGGTKFDFNTPVDTSITLTAQWDKLDIRVTGIQMNKSRLRLSLNQTSQLSADVLPSDASNKNVKWSSSDPKVASVKAGKVTAKKLGTATIVASAADGSGKSASCKVTVGYAVKYNLNGGKNNSGNPSAYYNENIVLKNPTRKGYLFKGWYQDKKFKKKITKISKKNTANLTIYAKWEKVKVGKASLKLVAAKTGQSIFVKYAKVSGAAGYEIICATDKKFGKNSKTVTTKATSYTVKSLQKNKTYYVKVRAYKTDSAGNKLYGKYSSVKSIVTKTK